MTQIVIRFLVGGLVVSSFAIIGDILRPKSFAGLFGAAPSVALATLALTVAGDGRLYAATEACSMIAGAISFFRICLRRKLDSDARQVCRFEGHDRRNAHLVWPGFGNLGLLLEIAMQIKIDISVLRETKWSDYPIRFLFGGMVTAAAGIIAKKFGPGVGGLFLAFPAIFPASATLIEKNAREEKRKAGLNGTRRGRMEAAVDAAGAAIG